MLWAFQCSVKQNSKVFHSTTLTKSIRKQNKERNKTKQKNRSEICFGFETIIPKREHFAFQWSVCFSVSQQALVLRHWFNVIQVAQLNLKLRQPLSFIDFFLVNGSAWLLVLHLLSILGELRYTKSENFG